MLEPRKIVCAYADGMYMMMFAEGLQLGCSVRDSYGACEHEIREILGDEQAPIIVTFLPACSYDALTNKTKH